MKTGRTLNQIAEELTRQKQARRDFIVPTGRMEIATDPHGRSNLWIADTGDFEITDHTHGQIATYTKIPKNYYDRMKREQPALLDRNVNIWMGASHQKRMIRTLDDKARAFLSDRYRPFDNYEVAENTLRTMEAAECRVESCEVTDKRFYLKAVSNRITHDVGVGDIVQAGIVVSNSEIGLGSLKVEPLIYKLSCLNGMISVDSSFRRNHVGQALGGDRDGAVEFFTDETRKASDAAVFLQIRDIVQGMMTSEGFASIVERFQASREQKLEGDAFEVVELLAKDEGLNEEESKGILASLLSDKEDGDTLFGLVNAVTDYSKHIDDYDRATEFERLGGKILNAQLAA